MSDTNVPAEPRREDYTRVSNPFGVDHAAVPSSALAVSDQQKSVAEVQARMIIARSNPRDPIRAMDQILSDCTRPTLAKKALYEYARGGTAISGPSIRLAEAIAQRWGNIASGIKEISRSGGYSECVAYAWDLQSGFYDERQFQVRHWRDTKQGGYPITDERDIYELIANMGQRRKRAVLLTVIPGDVVEAAVEQCEETLAATADTSPEALTRMVEAFEQFDVTREQIEKRIQRRIEAIRPAQVIQLSKIFASLTDGMSSAQDWFEVEGAAAPGGLWNSVDQAHAQAAQQPAATTRRSGRKAPAKEAAAEQPGAARTEPPQETAAQSVPRQTQAPAQAAGPGPNPPAAASTSASAGETARVSQPGSAVGTSGSEGGAPGKSSGPAFSAWLIDGDGVAIDGTEDFTDPVAFAKAYAKAYAEMFPPERKPFERANAESLAMAHELNPEGVAAALAPPAPPAPKAAEPAGVELPLDAPHDPAVITRPTKPTRAAFKAFNEALQTKVAIATEMQLGHIQAVNTETINGMPNAFRLEAVGIIEARRKELATPAAPARSNGAAATDIVEDLRGDVLSLTSAESVTTWLAMPRIKKHLDDLHRSNLAGWARVISAANSAYIRMRVEACADLTEFQSLDNDGTVNASVGWLEANDQQEFDAIIGFLKEHRAQLAG